MVDACVGLGSNLHNPRAQIARAVKALRDHPRLRVVSVSRLYGSSPVGPPQPDFVNAALSLQTGLEALALLNLLQAQESAQRRRRDGERWGPRTLDLDLLLYGDETITHPRLAVPHPGIFEREFVLRPLCDLCPGCTIPGSQGTVAEHLARVNSDGDAVWLLD